MRLYFLLLIAGSMATASAQENESRLADRKHSTQSEMVAYGNKAGMDAPVILKRGEGTASAMLKIDVGWNEEVHYCEEQYKGDENKIGKKKCIDSAKESFKGAKTLVASANCMTGDFVDFADRHLKFNGERPENLGGKIYYSPILAYEGFELGSYGYIGANVSAEQFKSMCPAGRPLAPKLPELEIPPCDNETIAKEATKLLVESGFRHMMNIKVIDIWDIKYDASYWDQRRCHAQISFNNGEDAVMEFSIYPKRSRFVLEVHLR